MKEYAPFTLRASRPDKISTRSPCLLWFTCETRLDVRSKKGCITKIPIITAGTEIKGTKNNRSPM